MMSESLESMDDIRRLTRMSMANSRLDPSLYMKYDVKRGLRDVDGKGVLSGLTNISEINAFREIDGERVAIPGELFYRGINVQELTDGFINEDRFGFEETTYLLLTGKLPDENELDDFSNLLAEERALPVNFVRDVIMKAPSEDIMNMLARCVLTMASYDERADDVSIENVMRQSIKLIAVFPLLAVYAYQAYNHDARGKSLYIHKPSPRLGAAENVLRLLRPGKNFSDIEAKTLDLALVLHMEHGGGNNSTFTTRVVTSSGTDTYSAIAAALASLKGPKHGGANLRVLGMFEDMKNDVHDCGDEEAIRAYLTALLDHKKFDGKGLVYGMGHAVYSISDPRAEIFRGFVERLAREKGYAEEYALYANTEKIARELIGERRKLYKGVCVNVDFYSGLVYRMLGLPPELFTAMFAVARIVGWSAHRIEELLNLDKIMRPAYDAVAPRQEYHPLMER